MDATKLRNRLTASDWYDINFLGGFLNADIKIKETLNEKRFIISNDMLPARTLNHWQQMGLIDDERPGGKGWRKFSMSEVIWIRIILKLRRFGMQLDKIRKVKEYLDIFDSKENQSKYPELDFFILFGLNTGQPVKLIVFDNGEARLGTQLDIDKAKFFDSIIDDYICIDINKLVNDGFKNKGRRPDYLSYPMSTIADEVEHSLYDKDVKSLKIIINNKKEYLIEKEVIKSTKNEVDMLFNKLNYADVTVKKRGKKKVFTITEKKKIKK